MDQPSTEETAVITTMCPCCCTQVTLAVSAVILARHMPTGDGAITSRCEFCSTWVCVLLSLDEVMRAVFAGASAIDIETVP